MLNVDLETVIEDSVEFTRCTTILIEDVALALDIVQYDVTPEGKDVQYTNSDNKVYAVETSYAPMSEIVASPFAGMVKASDGKVPIVPSLV